MMVAEKVKQAIAVFALAVAAFWTPSQAFAAASVDDIRVSANEEGVRIVFDLSAPLSYKYFMLTGPDRLIVDMADTRMKVRAANLAGGSVILQRIRYAPRDGAGKLRFVLDLNQSVQPKLMLLGSADGQGHRLVVDLPVPAAPVMAAQEKQPAAALSPRTATVAEKEVSSPPPPAPEPTTTSPDIESAVAANSRAPVSAPAAPRDVVIALDAGHGGIDPGARGYRGTHEKDVVLAIAKKLEALVNKEAGMRAVMIRDGDYFVPLRERTEKAREHKADLFVSIHADAFKDRRARGSSVYVLSPRGASSEAARWLAESENAADLVGGVSLDDKDRLLKSVLLDLSQTATIEASLEAGQNVLEKMERVGRLHRQQVEQAGFVVLKSPDIPSMLVETAFISNPAEEKRLRDPRHQQRLADAIMDGIRDHFHKRPPPGTKLAARDHVIAQGETLSGIAGRYGVSVESLRLANQMAGDRIESGGVLRIPTERGG